MSSHPNYKARLLRAARHNVPVQSAIQSFKKFKLFTILLVVLIPIYPSLSAIGETNQYGVVYVDDESIVTTFTDDQNLDYISEDGFVTIDPDSHARKAPVNTEVDVIPESNIQTYTVVEYDDIIKISQKYNIDPEVILWSNNLSMDDTLIVGQKLKIPPMTGLVHVLQPKETISGIAQKYSVTLDVILKANNISDSRKVKDGTRLLIPGGKRPEPKKEEPKPEEKKEDKKTQPTPKKEDKKPAPEKKIAATAPAKKASTTPVETPAKTNPSTGLKDRYTIKFTGKGRGFVPGNCTWHVARNKTVTWRGNANQWLRNARAQGVPTGKTAIKGAIIQFSGYGYSPRYGHVGIVTDVTNDHIIVSDMNYSGLYQITIRKIPKNHPAIEGYIYVD